MSNTFMNPLLKSGADPWVYRHHDGFYYWTMTFPEGVILWKSRAITDLATATKKTIWAPPATGPCSRNVWAPEIHWIEDKWYVYFTANDGGGDDTRQIFVLENASSDPLEGDWLFKGAVNTERPGLDGTVLQHQGELYFAYSGYGNFPDYGSALYMARMQNPWTLASSEVLISAPTDSWEKQGGMAINEGPVFLKRFGRIYLIFSASATWSDDYSLGMLTASETADLVDPRSWVKHPRPVFTKSAEDRVFAPGHNSFTQSPDGTEDWIVYHAYAFSEEERKTTPGQYRNPRVQKFGWNSDGSPAFGRPVPISVPLQKPAGEAE